MNTPDIRWHRAAEAAAPSFKLGQAMEPIVAAATRGRYEALITETERAFSLLFSGAPVSVLFRSGGAWREWSALEGNDDGCESILPAESLGWDRPHEQGSLVFVPITVGAVCLVVRGLCLAGVDPNELWALRQCVALALLTCERQRIAAQNLDEVQSLQRVATRMLKCLDLDEILLHITQEAMRLLGADICGVMLRETDEIVMRRCVGNLSAQTAALRMKPGQGLAGRVLKTQESVAVEDYLESGSISRDFFPLAEAERVRSALGAPLLGNDTVIGVLEVWRRRPSTFNAMDVGRLVALANLTSIAIENARLVASQRNALEELERANKALNQRYDAVRRLSNLTQGLLEMLLQRGGLPAIVAAASNHLETDVAVLDADLQVRAAGGSDDIQDALPAIAKALAKSPATHGSAAVVRLDLDGSNGRWLAQPLRVEGQATGWVLARADGAGQQMSEVALSQVVMATALHQLEQRAASRARAETIDALIWDVLQADEPARASAIDRAVESRIDLMGPMRLFLCELGVASGGAGNRLAPVREQVAQAVADTVGLGRVRATALRGLSVAVLRDEEPLDDAERWADRLAQRLAPRSSDRVVMVGGSSRCADARGLAIAYREAQIALDVARQLGRSGGIVYDRAGVVGMLLSLRHEAGMQRFLDLNLGDLLREDEKERDLLLGTLRAFFDANCSHEAAARRLGVHRKTIGYRLRRIAELTRLDLSTHDDRLVADLSLYVYRLLSVDR